MRLSLRSVDLSFLPVNIPDGKLACWPGKSTVFIVRVQTDAVLRRDRTRGASSVLVFPLDVREGAIAFVEGYERTRSSQCVRI